MAATDAPCLEATVVDSLDAKGSITKAASGTSNHFIIPQLIAEGEVTCVALTIEPPQGKKRVPVDIVCVIDVSGSMSDHAAIKSESGVSESHGLTLLDIAKHGVKTVIHTLGAEDRLAVVLFNHMSSELFCLKEMNEEGRAMAQDALDDVGPGGGTNLWSGMDAAYTILQESSRDGRFGHIMLLTDGQTTKRDSVVPNMRQYLEKHEKFPGTMSTFGFGYSIDSPLLEKVSSLGHGTYSFIPDAGFVGTIFVNTLSNLLCTCAMEVLMSVVVEDCEIVAPIGMPYGGEYIDLFRTNGEDATISIGNFQFDQPKTVVLALAKADPTANVCCTVQYVDKTGTKRESAPVEENLSSLSDDADARLKFYRACFAGLAQFATIFGEVPPCSEAAAALAGVAVPTRNAPEEPHRELSMKFFQLFCQSMEVNLSAGNLGDSEQGIKDLIVDTSGQATEAVSREDWWEKWGGHYLRSIMFAHRSQLCNNFKDVSVQSYGGNLFKEVQEKADDMFNTLPPPKPTQRRSSGYSSGYSSTQASAPASAPVNMAMYNNAYGVCIDSRSDVQLADGSRSAIGSLVKGDRVAALGGGSSEVLCVVSTACEARKADLVHLVRGARVTAYHPILVDDEWRFPCEIAAPQETDCACVCSVVLKGSPSLLVGSGKEQVVCAALGHGMEEGVARHPYFGSDQVRLDLQHFPGFDSGRIDLNRNDILRDPETGLVCQYRRA